MVCAFHFSRKCTAKVGSTSENQFHNGNTNLDKVNRKSMYAVQRLMMQELELRGTALIL